MSRPRILPSFITLLMLGATLASSSVSIAAQIPSNKNAKATLSIDLTQIMTDGLNQGPSSDEPDWMLKLLEASLKKKVDTNIEKLGELSDGLDDGEAPEGNDDDEAPEPTGQESINALASAFDKVIESFGKAPGVGVLLSDYREILGLKAYKQASFGVANAGLNAYVEKLLKRDARLRYQAGLFYNHIATVDRTHELREKRPALSQFAGEGEFSDIKPGWIFESALASAEGNPNDAIRLIGLCGHDDVSRSSLKDAANDLGGAIRDLNKKKGALDAQMDWLREEITRLYLSTAPRLLPSQEVALRIAKLKQRMQEYEEEKRKLSIFGFARTQLECPTDESRFFVPGSLDAKADLSDTLKEKLIRQMGSGAVPAKHYHVYGAAFVTCEIIRRGHSPRLAVALEQALAWSYRTVRITEKIAQMHETRIRIENEYKHYLADYARALKHYEQTGLWALNANGYMNQNAQTEKLKGKSLPAPPERLTLEQYKARYQGLGYTDGYELLYHWAVGGERLEIAGFKLQIPQTNFMIQVPERFERGFIDRILHRKPKGWSDQRFESARKNLKTILMDWQWTIEQHRKGAEFAASVCSSDQ